jgi:hypothetical protein
MEATFAHAEFDPGREARESAIVTAFVSGEHEIRVEPLVVSSFGPQGPRPGILSRAAQRRRGSQSDASPVVRPLYLDYEAGDYFEVPGTEAALGALVSRLRGAPVDAAMLRLLVAATGSAEADRDLAAVLKYL